LKGKPDALKDVSMEAELHKERLTTHFNGRAKRTVFEPNQVAVQTETGRMLDFGRKSTFGIPGSHAADSLGRSARAYFSSYALWNCLTIPSLYTHPGFLTEELNPCQENGEQWRPLKVTVPDCIASHSREQVAYFGPDGLLRRHGYTVDVRGGASGLNYAADYRNVDGIIVPMKRRVLQPTPTSKRSRHRCWLPSIFAISHFGAN
jgi:hypothetical protein